MRPGDGDDRGGAPDDQGPDDQGPDDQGPAHPDHEHPEHDHRVDSPTVGHGHDHDLDVTAGTRRVLGLVSAGMAVVVVLLVVALWPPATPDRSQGQEAGLIQGTYGATVDRVTEAACQPTTSGDEVCRDVDFRLTQGPDAGTIVTQSFSDLQLGVPHFSVGDRVVMATSTTGADADYFYLDVQRRPVLLWLAALFAVAVVLLGRLRGLAALVGLALSLVVLLRFIIPAILDGSNPVVVALVGSAVIAYIALYLAHGISAMTTVALLGTLAALALTAALAWLFFELCQFTGFASEEAFSVAVFGADVDIRGLLLGGVVIGAMGALDDMTVTQSSAVAELHAADPTMGRSQLFGAGLRIGRDHVASTVNTLVLAYAGASMPLLVLFVLSGQSLGTVANSEVVATEIVRTLVGSIGLVAAVPLTTWLASLVVPAPDDRPTDDRPVGDA